MKYKHIFFDLDRTLWDLERNNEETVRDLVAYHRLPDRGINDITAFVEVYKKINVDLWNQYLSGKMPREILRWKRFYDTLRIFEIDDQALAERFSNDFLSISPMKTAMMPHALEVVDYLSEKYDIYLITNGFDDIQQIKIKHCGLDFYIKKMFTSEKIGFQKPDTRIFEYVMNEIGASPETCLMIGDEYEIDIKGAKNSGIDQVFYSPKSAFGDAEATHKIDSLKKLMDIL